MSGLIVYGVLAAFLFATAFITRRRIGAPILGLAAGFILSGFWSSAITERVLQQNPRLDEVFISGAVAVAVILLPAILLTLHGGAHKSMIQRLVAAIFFTFIGLAFTVSHLGSIIVAGGPIEPLEDFLINYQGVIVALGVAVAVVDLAFTKLHKPAPPKGKH